MTPALFNPLELRDLTLKNRIWISPMCQYSADEGRVGTWHLVHLGGFATGGPGLIVAEATAVVPEGRISVGCPGLWNDELAEAWRPVVDFVHSMGTPIGIQLAHAGRKGSRNLDWVGGGAGPEQGGWQVVGPSANAYHGYPTARALEGHELPFIVQAFADAARRAISVGFDVLELHAAHGYLLHQFLSPISNQRTDEYGGSFDNRCRLLMEVVQAVRAVMPAGMPLFVRISATDWIEGGWDLDQSIKLAQLLQAEGVDLLDVSTAGLAHEQQVKVGPHYQVPFGAAIRRATGIATASVGLITDPQAANSILEDGDADAVMIARAALRNPRWPYQAAEALGYHLDIPDQLMRSRTV